MDGGFVADLLEVPLKSGLDVKRVGDDPAARSVFPLSPGCMPEGLRPCCRPPVGCMILRCVGLANSRTK